MPANRRVFLGRGAIAVGATLAVSPLSVLAAPRPSRVFTTSRTDLEVIRFVSAYGRDPLFVGGGVLARTNGVLTAPISLLVRVTDTGALCDSLDALPFKQVYANGNTLSFAAGGAVYQVENLPARDYIQRTSRLSIRGVTPFAHDAAHYSPNLRQVQDPLGAMTAGEARLRRTTAEVSLPNRVKQMLRGLIDAGRYGLVPDAEFDAFRRRTFAESANTPADIAAVAALLLGAVAPLSDAGQAAILAQLVASPLASSSFGWSSSQTGLLAPSRVQGKQAAGNRGGQANGAQWLALMLSASGAKPGVQPAVATVDYLSSRQTRSALAEIRRLSSTKVSFSK